MTVKPGDLLVDTVLLVVIADSGLNSLLSKNGTVDLYRGKTLKRLNNGGIGKGKCLVNRLTDNKIGSHRGGSYRRTAAKGLELCVGDDIVLYLEKYLHYVAALGVTNCTYAVGVLYLTHVVGV